MQEPAPVAPEEDASFAGGAAGLSEEASSSGAGRKRKGAGPEMVRANKKVRFQVEETKSVTTKISRRITKTKNKTKKSSKRKLIVIKNQPKITTF